MRQVRPAPPGGVVLARATVLEPGPPIGLAEVSLTDEAGALIAHGTSLLVVLPFSAAAADSDGGDAARVAHAGDETGPDPWERPVPEPAPGGPSPLEQLTGLRVQARAGGRRRRPCRPVPGCALRRRAASRAAPSPPWPTPR